MIRERITVSTDMFNGRWVENYIQTVGNGGSNIHAAQWQGLLGKGREG